MNRVLFGFLLISLFSLVSCLEQDGEAVPNLDGNINPLACSNGPGDGCETTWKMTFPKESFPQNVGIYINDKVIFDECSRDPKIIISRNLDTVEVTIANYIDMTGTEKFKLALVDLTDCYTPKKDFYLNANQSYKLKEIGTQKYLFINTTN